MKIEKLNENKIRITLSIEDLNERNIDLHSFMSNSIENQDIFFDMLDKADAEVGFNTDDCRIMIEALALKNGFFVLTITKFEHSKDFNPLNQKNVHKRASNFADSKKEISNDSSFTIKRKRPTFDPSKTIYSFESFDAFCNFCRFLNNTLNKEQIISFAKSADLYEYNSNYYLILSDIDTSSDKSQFICSSITEFAHFVNSSTLFERKVKEYGKLVVQKDAFNTCLEYFV